MKSTLLAVLLSVVVTLGVLQIMPPRDAAAPQQAVAGKESVYDRVMRTKTLHCGWFAEPPFINLDPNTNEKNGIVVDIINAFAADYGLNVVWETISNFAMMGEDLKQGKYDAVCASLISMPRGGLIDSVQPFVFVPAYGYVRNDETRLSTLDQLNDPAYRIAGQEGAAVLQVAKEKFPKAQFHIIPSAELSEMLVSVVAGKADVAFMIPTFYQQFLRNNPNSIKQLGTEPLQLFTFAFGVKPQEDGFKSLFNTTLQRMMVSGDLARIFTKYDPDHSLLYPTVSMTNGAKAAPPTATLDKP